MGSVSLHDVVAAAARLGSDIHRTPVLTSRMLDSRAGRHLFFKCEHLQRTGSFKLRGALNAVRCLDNEAAARGVITDSSGNFGQALAAAGAAAGVGVTVVMPANAPKVKQAAVAGYGGRVVLCPRPRGPQGDGAPARERTRGDLHLVQRPPPHHRWPGHRSARTPRAGPGPRRNHHFRGRRGPRGTAVVGDTNGPSRLRRRASGSG